MTKEMNDIFISYAREDREKAKAIATLFDTQGWSVWWDRSVPPGRSFDQVIEEALVCSEVRCGALVQVIRRLGLGENRGGRRARRSKILVPVRNRKKSISRSNFRRLQTVDLTRWNGDSQPIRNCGISSRLSPL